jgi:ribosomal protein S18 acetylase RimI-like enzyme
MARLTAHVREAKVDECSLLSRLVRDSFRDVAERFGLTLLNCPKHPSNCTDQWIQNDFARGVSYYILETNGKPIACVALEKANPDTCYLERLAVLPEYRRQGFGRMMVDYVLARAKEICAQRVSIGIIAEQTELKAWYKEIGFREGETKEFEQLPFLVTLMAHEF